MIKIDTGNLKHPRFISPGTPAFYAGDFPADDATVAKALALQSIVDGVAEVLAVALNSRSGDPRIAEEVKRVWLETERTVGRFAQRDAGAKSTTKASAARSSGASPKTSTSEE